MSIALNEEHRELARVARAFLDAKDVRAESRAMLESPHEALPPFWQEMSKLGWLGIHVPEAWGGAGYTLADLVVVIEAMGFALAPGPFLPTTLASALFVAHGSDTVCETFLPGLVDGSSIAAVGLAGSLDLQADGSLHGCAGLVLGAENAKLMLVCAGQDVAIVQAGQKGLSCESQKNLDPGRRLCEVNCNNVEVPAAHLLRGARKHLEQLSWTLAAAEAAGGARACTEMAAEYAKERHQFGRPIGAFGPVKHHCANMCVLAEQATAAAWGAARADLDDGEAELAAAIACSLAIPAFDSCAKLNIQVHGGIGFTWEHDAHLYMRRAIALEAFFGPVDRAREDVVRQMQQGTKTRTTINLPAEAETYRGEVRQFVANFRDLPEEDRRKALSDSGYLVPHWPRPWGRNAGPIEQLVIDEEFAGVSRPDLSISGWNTLTIAQHGTQEQLQRFVRPSLEGELQFCQLFSEPGAGSDAAGVQTRGVKVEGGWRVNGQKVWTSLAQFSNRGFATVRTNPDAAKHAGISMMVIDMHAEGVEVRPLRQITGHSHFNEVFFDDVFVPDEDVVGPVDGGWKVARSTLGNERVSLGGGSMAAAMPGAPDLAALFDKYAASDAGVAREVGTLLALGEAITLINLRGVIRAVEGVEEGAGASITKLLGSDVAQQTGALASRIIGPLAAVRQGEEKSVGTWLMATMSASIAGGTSEILRNQIAERLLGLPRDPLIK